jgi:hypothetical protein
VKTELHKIKELEMKLRHIIGACMLILCIPLLIYIGINLINYYVSGVAMVHIYKEFWYPLGLTAVLGWAAGIALHDADD